jgi:hypothetical protein
MRLDVFVRGDSMSSAAPPPAEKIWETPESGPVARAARHDDRAAMTADIRGG